jgi:GNAT superfamily N-acetyltransferase
MNQLVFRPALLGDFEFCQRLYFEGMDKIIRQLALDMARQRESFAGQWQVAEVRIVTLAGEDIGWLQTWPADDAIFLGQLYLAERFQRRGIGSRALQMLIDEAERAQKALALDVVKINPARRLYERLGFAVIHDEGEHKVHMRRELGTRSITPPASILSSFTTQRRS